MKKKSLFLLTSKPTNLFEDVFFVFLNIFHFGCNKIGLINGHVVSADFN
jgi:hypothetical protein